jgi:hypothetical protein
MKFFFTIVLMIISTSLASAQTASEIMESVRQVTVLQKEQTLTGVLRKGAKQGSPQFISSG